MTDEAPIPVTMLSGFLGAGKTTVLRHLLQNPSGLKIGCIVNDVASVNIDAKLVRKDQNKDATNTTSDLADTIELQNGCVCCSIQDELLLSFQQLINLAKKNGTRYDRIVLENSGVAEPQNIRDQFSEAIASGNPIASQVELSSLVTVVDSACFLREYSSRDPVSRRPDLGEGGSFRPVVDLLVEQIECADYILLNKADQLNDPKAAETLVAIMSSLNSLAQVITCSFGQVPLDEVFGKSSAALMAHLNTEGMHRGAVAAALEPGQQDEQHTDNPSHEHHHEHHGHADDCSACKGGHTHDHAHDHAHDHDHHKHQHQRQTTTAAKRFGIKSFVYRRRRPFHPKRLRELVLRWLPVATNAALGPNESPAQGDSPVRTVLRSKGFVWMASGHATAYYWSHAGQHFEIRDEGDWWSAVPDGDWPQNQVQRGVIFADWDAGSEFGDRRQEIVFIGTGMNEDAIQAQLDTALLTDDEFKEYKAAHAGNPDPVHPGAPALAT